MKKSERKLLAETLDKALDPPSRRKPALASQLAEYDDADEKVTIDKESITATEPRRVGLGGVTPPNPIPPVSPVRNFNKRANSLDRLALPAGIFPGSSKKLYDALYVRTRGAITPVRTIRATKRSLSDWSGIRNIKTIDAHLRYFSAIGLIISEWERGQNDGAVYEVLLPEETSELFVSRKDAGGVTPPNPTSPPVTPRKVEEHQILESPRHQILESPHLTQVAIKSTVSKEANTSFKTNTKDDDEALTIFAEVMTETHIKMTGKPLNARDKSKWGELGHVLAHELERVSQRVDAISSVPAFLVEHLRRRLNHTEHKEKGAVQPRDSQRNTIPQVTTSPAPKPISLEERAELVQMVVELIDNDGYTMEQAQTQFGPSLQAEDWQTIRERIKEVNSTTS